VYEAHFGLHLRPFGESVSPSTFIALRSHDATLRRLRYALEHGQGSAVLFGPPGSGKTLLVRRLASELHSRTVHLTFPALAADELVAYVASEFTGVTAPVRSQSAALRQLRDHLAASAARQERPLLVVDDAHLIDSVSAFETLRLLLNFASLGPPDLSLLLVGGAEILLDLPPGFADRLAARCLLGTLSEAESSAYLLGRLTFAGAKYPLISPSALSLLHAAAGGLPRRLNHLADLALLIAYGRDLAIADDSAVSSAVGDLGSEIAA
jgi:type II secretory pathway predicted ATPase ExeA